MILAQLSWTTTFVLAWMLFGGWLLAVETIAEVELRRKQPGRKHLQKYWRKWQILLMGWSVWLFVPVIIFLNHS